MKFYRTVIHVKMECKSDFSNITTVLNLQGFVDCVRSLDCERPAVILEDNITVNLIKVSYEMDRSGVGSPV
jgi:hypothetical protein